MVYKGVNIRRATGAGVLSLAMVVGFSGLAGATNTGSIVKTGPDSTNVVRHKDRTRVSVRNDNDLDLSNSNYQTSHSGSAVVSHNTTGGTAWSGDTANDNTVSATVQVDNSAPMTATLPAGDSGSATATIENTGPDSYNKVVSDSSVRYRVSNDNDIDIRNTSTQTATSGNATVTGNTTGGDAMSGNVSNSSSSSFTVRVSN